MPVFVAGQRCAEPMADCAGVAPVAVALLALGHAPSRTGDHCGVTGVGWPAAPRVGTPPHSGARAPS
eukprot:15476113-Alexandrium_andersonii.AAC.1